MTRLLVAGEEGKQMETSLRNGETLSIVSARKGNYEDKKSPAGSLDDVLTWLGWMGPYQRLQCFLLMLPIIDSAMHSISFIFIGKFVDHRCAPFSEWIPETVGGHSFSNFTSAKSNGGLVVDAKRCTITVTNNSGEIFSGACPNGYTYFEPQERSFVSEWNLVCDEEALSDASQTVMAVGAMVGAFLFTAMADKLGRKPVYVVSHILLLVSAAATAFAPDLMTFMALRFVLGALQQGVNLTSWILMIELIPTLKRDWPSRVSNFVWPSGLLLLGLVCFLCRDLSWRYTELVLASFSCYSLIQWCLLDESLRWLTVKGRTGEVERIIMKAAKRNGVKPAEVLEKYKFGEPVSTSTDLPTTSDLININGEKISIKETTKIALDKNDSALLEDPQPDPGLSAFVSNKHILLVTVIICYLWLVDSLSYVILTITSDSLTKDFYLGYLLSILVEMPAACVFWLLVSRVKRRTWIVGAHLIAGTTLALSVVLSNVPGAERISGIDVIVPVLSLLAKFGTTVAFNLLWLYTPELFPTTIRTTGLGLASVVSKLAGMAAPFARTLSRHYPWAPGAVLSGLCLTVPLLIQLMPETYGRDLPQTVAEMESWLSQKSRKTKEKTTKKDGYEILTFEED
ncbi:hypothetical protein EGW08_015608 [Elysia chlorotica]|uniref:Major facilitator superfamily (MFS) profile domain-containing protein n=1 Tax=Elysia chlorotica TaxID=188477 RepID=A0A3S1HCM6_ELYCH|nr:hypothetical protein EGW08_015608 [Elysia chlorotica]